MKGAIVLSEKEVEIIIAAIDVSIDDHDLAILTERERSDHPTEVARVLTDELNQLQALRDRFTSFEYYTPPPRY